MLAIILGEFLKYGCPNCGCDTIKGGNISGYGVQFGICKHCNLTFEIRSKKDTPASIKHGAYPKESSNPNSKYIMESGIMIQHPRIGIPKWHWEPKDERPENGEYWKPRGIGYDLSGFVKTKASGERIHEIVKKVLEKEKPESWLDYRESEPTWIQYKLQPEEFNLELIYDKTKDTGILTEEILIEAKL